MEIYQDTMVTGQVAMRNLLRAGLFSMLAAAAFAQGHGMSVRVPLPASAGGIRSSSHFPNAHFGFNTPRRRFSRGAFFPGFGLGYPWLGDYGYGYSYQPEPTVIVVTPPPAPVPQVIMQAPPKPIQAQIKEYHPPDTGDSSPFSIALKDGSVRHAMAVWVTDDTLHYIDTTGKPGQAPLESVDRQATRKLNAGKNVQSWLPG
jgi:hypothetical protein